MQHTLSIAHPHARPLAHSLDPLRAVLWGTLLTGTLDGLEAVGFWALRDVAPSRVFQGIAAGLLGRATFQGGAATTALGVGLMFFICGAIVALYLAASRRFEELVRAPWRWGALYGAAVFAVMNFVVVPLSAAGGRPPRLLPTLNCLLANLVCIGIPTALVARAAARNREGALGPAPTRGRLATR